MRLAAGGDGSPLVLKQIFFKKAALTDYLDPKSSIIHIPGSDELDNYQST